MIEACFFDLDKTAIDEQGRLYDGLDQALSPDTRDFRMTILTARGYTRYQEALRENPSLAVTPGMPVALENGGRIIDSEARENLCYNPLSPEELDAVCAYIDTVDPLRYVAFHPEALRTKTLLWSPDRDEAERLRAAWSHNADVFTGRNSKLFEVILNNGPCMITCRTYGEKPRNLPTEVSWYSSGSTVNFVPGGIDKGWAARAVADIAGLHLNSVLAAGNDERDLPMLQLEELGCPVAVGPEMTDEVLATLPDRTVHVPDPRNLGDIVLARLMRP